MKILRSKVRNRGLVWVVIFFFIGVLGLAAYFLWRVFTWHPQIDITHGNGDPEDPEDPETQQLVAGEQWLQAQVAAGGTNSSFFIPALGVVGTVGPGQAINPREIVRSSTNLKDWRVEDIGWIEACEDVLTNQSLPAKFYQRALVW